MRVHEEVMLLHSFHAVEWREEQSTGRAEAAELGERMVSLHGIEAITHIGVITWFGVRVKVFHGIEHQKAVSNLAMFMK